MLAVVAAIVFALALLFDLADVTSDAFDYQTLITLGLLLLALHLAGFGASTNWRRSWSRPRSRRRR
jgi:cell division protein FtsW (lipid II flippase)